MFQVDEKLSQEGCEQMLNITLAMSNLEIYSPADLLMLE
jgi:hypothetical protein